MCQDETPISTVFWWNSVSWVRFVSKAASFCSLKQQKLTISWTVSMDWSGKKVVSLPLNSNLTEIKTRASYCKFVMIHHCWEFFFPGFCIVTSRVLVVGTNILFSVEGFWACSWYVCVELLSNICCWIRWPLSKSLLVVFFFLTVQLSMSLNCFDPQKLSETGPDRQFIT